MAPDQRRWGDLSPTTKDLLALSPDENECLDFKENIQPVTDHYLAMMANASALAEEDHATVLVGVAEEKDATTGVTSGKVVGLTGDLHRIAEAVAQRASMTKPTPVRVEIVEENVDSAPILRVEITPTLPPHYDQAGRRSTRQHTTSRAMSDEEILRLLEARERRRYAGVAEDTANLMMGDLRVVTDEVMERIERQQSDTDDVASHIDQLLSRMDDMEMQLIDLPRDFNPADPDSMEHSLTAVVNARTMGLMAIAPRIDELGDEDIDALDRVVNSLSDVLAFVRNRRELEAWRNLLDVAFRDGSDIVDAVHKVVAAHDEGGQPEELSTRAVAARFNRERGALRPKGRHSAPRPGDRDLATE